MGTYTEAWRSVHNLLAEFASLVVLEPVLKQAADAEGFIAQHADAEVEVGKLKQEIKGLQARARKTVEDAERDCAKRIAVTDQEIASRRQSFIDEQARIIENTNRDVRERQGHLAKIEGRIAEREGELSEAISKVNLARMELTDLETQIAGLRERVGRL